MRKNILLLTITVFSLLFVRSVHAEEIRDFSSNITVNKDGTIAVVEKIKYDFGQEERHGIYRDIPRLKTNEAGKKFVLDITVLSVADEKGNRYQYKKIQSGENLQVKIGDPDRTITGVHIYVISYKVGGTLTYFSDHDEFYWNITGNSWTTPITIVSNVVTLPAEVDATDLKLDCYTGLGGSTEKNCTFSQESGNVVTFKTNKVLNSSEGLTIVVGFPKGIVAVFEPKPYLTFWQTIWGKLTAVLLILLATFWYLIYPVKIIYKWIKYGRDPKGSIGEVQAGFDPPKNSSGRFLTPGEVGTLGDETADLKDISATIVDLARRGYLRIEERKKKDFYFIATDKLEDRDLQSFEKKLLVALFKGEKELRLKDVRLAAPIEGVKKSLYESMMSQKFFPENPNSIRNFYSIIGGIAIMTGNLFLIFVAMLFGRNLPRKTEEGVNAFNVAKSLKNFLTSQERQLAFQANNQMFFEKLLPYAVAFGVEKIWAKRFEDFNLKSPDWYQGYEGGSFNSVHFTNRLNSTFSSFRSAATPTSSSSGFGSGFSGGSSGGGGGGGGGGSW